MRKLCAPIHYLQRWVVPLPYAVPYMLHIKFSDHYPGTADTKNSRCCTMYFFLYHDDYYGPLKIKSLSGHIHMYKMENKLLPSQVTATKILFVGQSD